MPRHWYIKTKGGPRGPVTSKVLVHLADKGTLKPKSLVSDDGESWFQAKHIEGLEFHEAMSKRWHVRTKRGDAGPFSLPKLAKLAKQGRLHPNHAISSDGKSWIKAKRLPDLVFDTSHVAKNHDSTPADQPIFVAGD